MDDDSVTDEALHQVCRDAGIHDFIVSLPDGYNTKTGIKGILLSGGQRQRVSIARALIRNPRLLLLDEATSNLDSETEKMVQAVFEQTKKDRTMIVVAHRLATVQNADIIFVLGDGQILETGTHASLLQRRGVYYSMVRYHCLPPATDCNMHSYQLSSVSRKPWIDSGWCDWGLELDRAYVVFMRREWDEIDLIRVVVDCDYLDGVARPLNGD